MRIFLAVIAIIFFTACNRKTDYKTFFENPDLYAGTVHELNSIVMGNNFTPVVASRNYAYAAIAGYEVIAAGFPEEYNSLAGQLRGFKAVPKPDTSASPIDYEYAALLAYCKVGEAVTFPEGSMQDYVDSLNKKAEQHGMPEEMMAASKKFADTIAATVIAWSKKDNYLETRSASKYSVNDSVGRWVPTPPMYAQAVEPHWREIRPMMLDSATQFRAPAPPAFNITDKKSKYYSEVIKIKNAIDSLTPAQKQIADFWDDNPFKLNVSGHVMFSTKKFSPTGHWMSIVGIAAKKAHADFATTVYAYAKTAITFFDAFIQCWDVKFAYNTVRPETVINKYIDPEWHPYLQTPAFPEYTCGHSTISAAAAEALTSIFGDNFQYTDSTEQEFGIDNRSFTSFRAAAVENNWARFYGGIHFHNSCIISTEYGKKVGDFIVARLHMKKSERNKQLTTN